MMIKYLITAILCVFSTVVFALAAEFVVTLIR